MVLQVVNTTKSQLEAPITYFGKKNRLCQKSTEFMNLVDLILVTGFYPNAKNDIVLSQFGA